MVTRARKQVLVDHGFRLPSALDNRPLTFDEFEKHIHNAIFVSATPGPFELEHTPEMIKQIIRPTGLLDPTIEVRPIEGQIDDIIAEIHERIKVNERVLDYDSDKENVRGFNGLFKRNRH